MSEVQVTLNERGSRYGAFDEGARIEQNLKDAMRDSPNWDRLEPYMKSCLEMQASKISRILLGDPYYSDNWHDMAGYSTLVDKILTTGSVFDESPTQAKLT